MQKAVEVWEPSTGFPGSLYRCVEAVDETELINLSPGRLPFVLSPFSSSQHFILHCARNSAALWADPAKSSVLSTEEITLLFGIVIIIIIIDHCTALLRNDKDSVLRVTAGKETGSLV